MDLVHSGKRVILLVNKTAHQEWAYSFKTPPAATQAIGSAPLIQPKAPAMGASCEGRLDTEIRTSSWETGEGSGTHNDEVEVILIFDSSKAHFSSADVRPDNQTVGVSEVDPPGAGSGTHDDDAVLPPNPGDGMGHFSDAFE